MNKKGFTLIELMGIIIILSLISLLVIPTIDKSIKLFKENAYNNQIANIKLAAKNWGTDNLYKFTFKEGDIITISLGQLQMESYVEDDLKNPKTDIPFGDNMLINIVKATHRIDYYVLTDTASPYDGTNDYYTPTIIMNGKYIERVILGSIYTDQGVVAKTFDGVIITGSVTQVITKDGSVVGSINTNVAGTYVIAYSVSDDYVVGNNLTRTIFRNVVVS